MKKFKIPKNKRTKWIKALESGRYKQTQFSLSNSDDTKFCCLGVYSKCNRIYAHGDLHYPPEDELDPKLQNICIELNDKDDKNFKEIAKYIKSNTIGV